jgi:hypothetical protein
MQSRQQRLASVGIMMCCFFAAACGGLGSSTSAGGTEDTGTSTADTTTDPFATADWRLLTARNIKAGIDFTDASGAITIVNSSGGTLDAPTLRVFDTTTAAETTVTITEATTIADGATYTGTLTYPGSAAPTDSAYYALALGSTTFGKFVAATTFAGLSPAVTQGPSAETSTNMARLTKSSDTFVPTAGIWDFSMTGGVGNLSGSQCPSSGTVGLVTGGDSTLSVSCDGYSLNLDIDGSNLSYHLTSTSTGLYQTPTYTFPALDGNDNPVTGTNYYELTATASEAMSGGLFWDNSVGCTAEYPITMALDSASPTAIHDLCEGSWTLDYTSPTVTCGTDIFTLVAQTYVPQVIGTLSTTDTPAGLPFALNYASSGNPLFLWRQGCTNIYGNMLAPSFIGPASDTLGNLFVVDMSFQGIATAKTQITGTGIFHATDGSGTCTVPFLFTMTAVIPC